MRGLRQCDADSLRPLTPPSPHTKSGLPDFVTKSAQVGQVLLSQKVAERPF
jgi:hypothetical protein